MLLACVTLHRSYKTEFGIVRMSVHKLYGRVLYGIQHDNRKSYILYTAYATIIIVITKNDNTYMIYFLIHRVGVHPYLYWGDWIACFKDEKGKRLISTVRYDIKVPLYEAKMVITMNQRGPNIKRDLQECGNNTASEMVECVIRSDGWLKRDIASVQ